ncbi:hypothetical protein [Marinovum algicola]|uniref:hypothetical protein n=1 Tax=Marinovum algicola TaxID=42444 RepID=UPI003B522030
MPEVPEALLAPNVVPERRVSGLKSVGLILADHVEALEAGNADKAAIRCILDAAKAGAEPACTTGD